MIFIKSVSKKVKIAFISGIAVFIMALCASLIFLISTQSRIGYDNTDFSDIENAQLVEGNKINLSSNGVKAFEVKNGNNVIAYEYGDECYDIIYSLLNEREVIRTEDVHLYGDEQSLTIIGEKTVVYYVDFLDDEISLIVCDYMKDESTIKQLDYPYYLIAPISSEEYHQLFD